VLATLTKSEDRPILLAGAACNRSQYLRRTLYSAVIGDRAVPNAMSCAVKSAWISARVADTTAALPDELLTLEVVCTTAAELGRIDFEPKMAAAFLMDVWKPGWVFALSQATLAGGAAEM